MQAPGNPGKRTETHLINGDVHRDVLHKAVDDGRACIHQRDAADLHDVLSSVYPPHTPRVAERQSTEAAPTLDEHKPEPFPQLLRE